MSESIKATTTRFELKQLFHLMLPILVTQFAYAGFGLIDTIMAGHMSAEDLAAIAVGVGLWIPIMLLFSGIMIATTPLVAEANGARTPEKIPSIVRQSLWVALVLGIIAMLILQAMPLLLPLFGVPDSLLPKASLFLHAIAFGMPAVTMYAALRNYSEARLSTPCYVAQSGGFGGTDSAEFHLYVWHWTHSTLRQCRLWFCYRHFTMADVYCFSHLCV